MNALSSSPIATSVSAPRYAGLRPLPQGGSEGQVGKGCWGGSEGQTQNPSAWTALTISSPSLHSPTPGETATTLFSTIPTSTLCPLAMNSPETLGDATRCNKVGSYVSAASLGPGGGGGGWGRGCVRIAPLGADVQCGLCSTCSSQGHDLGGAGGMSSMTRWETPLHSFSLTY